MDVNNFIPNDNKQQSGFRLTKKICKISRY